MREIMEQTLEEKIKAWAEESRNKTLQAAEKSLASRFTIKQASELAPNTEEHSGAMPGLEQNLRHLGSIAFSGFDKEAKSLLEEKEKEWQDSVNTL